MTAPIQEPTQGRVDQQQGFVSRQLLRRPAPPSAATAVYAIKLSGDDSGVDPPAYVGNGVFYVGIPSELNDWYVVKFWGYQSTPTGGGGADTELRLRRTDPVTPGATVTVTSTTCKIHSDEYYPYQQAVIDDTLNQVQGETNFLRIDVLNVELDSIFGLSCEITLSPTNTLL